MLVIMTKLELVIALRKIALTQNCHLTLRAASKIADWIKDGTAYDITSYLKKQEEWMEANTTTGGNICEKHHKSKGIYCWDCFYQEDRKEFTAWIKSHHLIKPDDNSITRFEPFYQIEQAELKEWLNDY